MRKILFEIPGVGWKLPSFGPLMLLACIAALAITAWRARREKLDPDTVFELAIWLMSGGFIGARLLFIIAHPDSIHNLMDIFKLWQGGIVFYGCILGGLIGSLMYWYKHPFPFRPMADAVAPALAIGSAIGRIGCFMNGCCYGGLSQLPWAIAFPAGSLPWARQVQAGLILETHPYSLPVHPTQLYAALDGFLILAVLTAYYPRRRRDGEVMALLMFLYPLARFFEEALRSDEPALWLGLTMSQWISIGIFMGGLIVAAYLRTLPPGRYADQHGPTPASSQRRPMSAPSKASSV